MNEFKIKNGLIVDQDGANITGSSTITGSLTVTGSITSTQGFTGSLQGTASYASTYASVFPFTGSAIISGSLEVTGSIRALVTGSDLVNIGNRVTTNQRLVRIGQDTAWVDIGSLVGSTSNSAIYLNQATPSANNYTLTGTTSYTALNTAFNGIIYISENNNPRLTISGLNNSSTTTAFTFTTPANTNQTTTANIPNFRITGANKQWATGTVANQYWNYLTSNTASFVGASTMTNSYGLFVEAATAGTNATITNNWAIGANGGGIIVRGFSGTVLDVGNTFSIFNVVASSGICSAYNLFVTNGAMTIQTVTPTLIFNNSTVQIRRNSNSLFLDTYDDLTVRNTLSSYDMLVLRGTKTTGASNSFVFTTPSNTGQTATTNIPNFRISGANKQWATGNITNQYWNYLTANTASFVGVSTVTSSFGLFVEAATAGTNATITNNYAAGFSGSVQILTGGLNVTGSVNASSFTGSLFGTASYASTASYINGNITKANALSPGMFGGTPLTASITFAANFPNPSYSITITGEDARVFTIQNKSANGFEINTNSNIALTGTTYWHAINYGEFNS